MSITTPSTTTSTTLTTNPGPLWRSTVLVGLASAAVVTAAAATMHAAGVAFEVDGETIPLVGFAQMTFVGAVAGGLLVAALNRWSHAARRFLPVAVVLTTLSCIPSIAMPDDAATKVALVALHLVSAAMIVPVIQRHADA